MPKVFDTEYWLEWWSKQEDAFLELEPEEAARVAFLAGFEASQQCMKADGAYCACKSPDLYSDGGADVWCRSCGKPPRR